MCEKLVNAERTDRFGHVDCYALCAESETAHDTSRYMEYSEVITRGQNDLAKAAPNDRCIVKPRASHATDRLTARHRCLCL